MKAKSPRLAMGTLATVLITLLACQTAFGSVLSASEVESRTGKGIDEWGAEWWQWAFAHPEVFSDTTGRFAHRGDVGGPVFFAEGSSGDPVRAYLHAPEDQYVLLPVATYLWTFFDPCAEINCARSIINQNFIDGIKNVTASIDGVEVTDLAAHLVRVDDLNPLIFQVDAGPVGPDGYGGILDAVQGGYWLMLDPLSRGRHQIQFSANVPALDPITGERVDGSYDLDAELNVSVPAPSAAWMLALGLISMVGRRRCVTE